MSFNISEYSLLRRLPVNVSNISVELSSSNENSIDYEFLSLFIDYTSYIFYTSIFLLGITGNSIVIYVLLKPIFCGSKTNREYFAYNNQLTSQFHQNSPAVKRNASLGHKKFQSSLRRSPPFNNNEEIVTRSEVKNLNK